MDKEALPPELQALADDEAMQEDYRTLWTLLQRASRENDSEFDVDAAWTDLAGDLDLDGSDRPETKSTAPSRHPDRSPTASKELQRDGHERSWRRIITGAATVVLIAVGLLAWWSQPVTVETSPGRQTAVSLPDGSTVELNGGSAVSYDRGFASLPFVDASVRQVRVEGEAYFEVASSERPFRVRTPNAMIEVLGTAFNVRARSGTEGTVTDVVLAEGQIRLAGASAASAVVLDRPGSRSRVEGTRLAPSDPEVVDLKYADAWRNGGFAVRNVRLPAILIDLEEQFGATLRLAEDVRPGDPLTLHYGRAVTLEDVLHDLCVIQGLTYRKTNDGYVLRKD